ncbi:MAG: hypothetical protein ACRET5_06160 [Steroidobacteraceae bacterium]
MSRAAELSDETVPVSISTLCSILERALADDLVVGGQPCSYLVLGVNDATIS